VHRDRVRVVLVAAVAPQLQRPAGGRRVGGERVGVEASRAGHAGDPQAAGGQLRRVAPEEAAGPRLDGLVARDPDDAAVVGVPVALLEGDVHDHGETLAPPATG
jgi:hypothetical protein